MVDLILIRIFFVIVLSLTAIFFRPAGASSWLAAAIGAILGLSGVAFAHWVQRISLQRLVGLGVGVVSGLVCAALVSSVLGSIAGESSAELHFAQIACLLLLAYVGGVIGLAKSELLNLTAFGLFSSEKEARTNHKILDTSVIIDGRIADIAGTGFLEGTLVVPQFVLHELQMVADSADSMKRNRGRRGLDVLQRMQKMTNIRVQLVNEDFPHVREVDMKLIELARFYKCKIITNDFNLNKVAHVRGVEVLNINELANSLKPIVLPGELMRVFILKEGKEYNQGVAYLDDGTMVVIDNARRMISRTIDISVTSVLQTTAGKMIFGKYDERAQAATASNSASAPAAADRRDPPRREQIVGES